MLKVIILRGLPASGKSTYAKDLCKKDPSYIRINNDDMRMMLSHEEFTYRVQPIIKSMLSAGISAALNNGYNVVVDNTNLSNEALDVIHKAVSKANLQEYVHVENLDFFSISVEDCIERDKHREFKVGEEIIRSMYNEYKHLYFNDLQ